VRRSQDDPPWNECSQPSLAIFREISYHNVTSILIPSIHPQNFPALESVSIRMLNVDRPIGVIERLPRSVKSLEIWKFDTMIHDHLFSAIASRLPDLRELRLHGMGEVDKFGVGTLFDSADTLGVSLLFCAMTRLFISYSLHSGPSRLHSAKSKDSNTYLWTYISHPRRFCCVTLHARAVNLLPHARCAYENLQRRHGRTRSRSRSV
jgi:hypothetical protein